MADRISWGDYMVQCQTCGTPARTDVLGYLPEDWLFKKPARPIKGYEEFSFIYCPRCAKLANMTDEQALAALWLAARDFFADMTGYWAEGMTFPEGINVSELEERADAVAYQLTQGLNWPYGRR